MLVPRFDSSLHPEMSYISTFCFLGTPPPDEPEARVGLPDLRGGAAGVRVLARAEADPVALPDLPRGAGGGEALGGGGRGSNDGCSGAVGLSWIAKGLAFVLGAGGGGEALGGGGLGSVEGTSGAVGLSWIAKGLAFVLGAGPGGGGGPPGE